MIIDNIDEMPFLKSSICDFIPTEKEEAEGTLRVDGREYTVMLHHEPNRRIWIRIPVAGTIADRTCRLSVLKDIAQRGIANEDWRCLCVDPRDGETILSSTLTVDLSPEAIDRFLEMAQEFLATHGEELQRMMHSCDNDGDDGSGFNPSDLPFDLDDLF